MVCKEIGKEYHKINSTDSPQMELENLKSIKMYQKIVKNILNHGIIHRKCNLDVSDSQNDRNTILK